MRLSWVAACAVVAVAVGGAGQAIASGTGASGSALGPVRMWGGTEIRSLDPPSAAAAASPPPPGSGSAQVQRDEVLSNEQTFTRWAGIAHTGLIYGGPATASAHVGRLHRYTEDGFPEVYLLLRSHRGTNGQEWVRLRIPARPNGQTGWVRRQDLGTLHLTHTLIIVNRARLRMYLYTNGRRVWSAPVAVGKPSTPTPSGHFWIRERFKIEDPRSGYWPYAFGTSDYSTLSEWPRGGVIGIHGPYYQAQSIPGRISHGCIRLRTSDDAWLARHIGLGTPVQVI